MAEKAVKEETVKTDDARMLDILDRAVPVQLQERLAKMAEEHESPYRLHPDMVAVFDVSTNSLGLTDGVPPYYDVVTGSDLDREVRGDEAVAEHTKQMLRITDRYEIVINHVPETGLTHKYTVVPRTEWEEYEKKRGKGMLSHSQEIAGIMLRTGGAV